MKGVILAGGTGSRLLPLTIAVNKHLLPVYNKPMIYYPLTNLILLGITEIAIVVRPKDLGTYKELLGDGRKMRVNIAYFTQELPNGIGGALKSCSTFFDHEPVCVILGDNLVYGPGMGRNLLATYSGDGAMILAQQVKNPQDFGVVQFDEYGIPVSIIEKPSTYISNWAIPGFYFYDNSLGDRLASIQPSDRGEIEVSDINKSYLATRNLRVFKMPLGTAWLDLGNPASLIQAGTFIQVLEERQGIKIGDPYTAAVEIPQLDKGF